MDHLYPQADVQLAQAPGSYDTLRVIWTEPLGSGQYAICFARFPHLNAGPGWFYEIVCGQEDASPYCIHRDGPLALDEYSLDFAESELVYRLSYLNPLYRYWVSATVYHEGSAPLVQGFEFPVDSTSSVVIPGVVACALPGEPVEVLFDVPAELYRDGVTDLVISKLEGDYAAVAGIELHELEPEGAGSGSGSQFSGRTTLRHPPAILGVLPNPFTRATTIRYQVLDAGPVSLKILDVTGRCVREVKTDSRRSGIYAAPWDGLDDHNRALPNGVYFCQLESNGSRSTAKVCLTR